MLENWTDDDLRNAIWMDKDGMVPKGGYPREWYEEELYRRTGSRKGFHEQEDTITFCEMHKNSGGCEECPNRYVCPDSTLKIKSQPKNKAATLRANTDKNFLVGYYVVKKDEEYTDNGYACAAWFQRILVKAGRYPVMASQYAYHERDRYYMDQLADRSLSIKLPGIVTAADFQGRYFGRPIGGPEASNKHVGQPAYKILSPYAHSVAIGILEGISQIELLPEFEAREIPFVYDGISSKTYGIFRRSA